MLDTEMTHRQPGLRTPPAEELSPPHTPPQKPVDLKDSEKVQHDPLFPNKEEDPVDLDIADDYVTRTLQREPALPPIKWKNILAEIQWVSFIVLTSTPILGVYGLFTTNLQAKTAAWAALYYLMTGLGITAGYHRLWAHRAYVASRPLEYFLAFMGSGAVQGSIHWWARGHRAHHRYTDTDLDPYGAHFGLIWSHLGWMIVKPRRKPGVADISDLRRHPVIKFQHKFYIPMLLLMGFLFPTMVAGFGWGDWRGGFFYAAVLRLVFVHHSTFCVNSLAHWLGEASFDNKITPRDHFFTALVTVGEGYHNFHHQFPMDYRNAIKWYQYDPTKWFISSMQALGLASHLKVFPDNEVRKGQLTMQLKKAHEFGRGIQWPKSSNHLPVISWDQYQEESKSRALVVVHGFVHDVTSFIDEHPGGRHLLVNKIGKDASTAFIGGVYDHSNAAHNLLSMMRVGVIDGGYELEINKQQAAAAQAERPPSPSSDEDSSAPGTPSDEPRRIHPKASSYITPGETYSVVMKGSLEENVRAKSSGKLGKLI